jgi:hypothetical protein
MCRGATLCSERSDNPGEPVLAAIGYEPAVARYFYLGADIRKRTVRATVMVETLDDLRIAFGKGVGRVRAQRPYRLHV